MPTAARVRLCVDLRTQPQHLGSRIVVIAQVAGHFFNLHALQPRGVENVAGRSRAAHRGRQLLCLGIGCMDAPLRPEPQQDRGRDEHHVLNIARSVEHGR